MNHPTNHPLMKCAVCGRVLDVITDESDGSLIRYRHTGAQIAAGVDKDHKVKPVPADQFAGDPRCDFCLASLRPPREVLVAWPDGSVAIRLVDGEGWRLRAEKIAALIVGADGKPKPVRDPNAPATHFDEDWCACDDCAELIRADKWRLLTRRAADAVLAQRGESQAPMEKRLAVMDEIWPVYSALRSVATGPLEPFYPEA